MLSSCPSGAALAAAQAWIGRRRRQRLAWAADPALHRLAATSTTDIRCGESAGQVAAAGNAEQSRIDGRRRVGPLQSLAGTRPGDDITMQREGMSLQHGQLCITLLPDGSAPLLWRLGDRAW